MRDQGPRGPRDHVRWEDLPQLLESMLRPGDIIVLIKKAPWIIPGTQQVCNLAQGTLLEVVRTGNGIAVTPVQGSRIEFVVPITHIRKRLSDHQLDELEKMLKAQAEKPASTTKAA